MKKLLTLIIVLVSTVVFALDRTPPIDPNKSIGTWTILVGEDVNQPVWGVGTRYEGKQVILSATGLPAGLALFQTPADMNLPTSEWPYPDDPGFKRIMDLNGVPNGVVGKAYVRGRLTVPVALKVAVISAINHSETLTIKTREAEMAITDGSK